MIDVHVHLAALPDGQNDCLVSPKLRRSPIFRFIVRHLGLSLDDPAAANRNYFDKLCETLSASRRVRQAVLLAVDGVYDDTGRLDAARTDFLVSNDAVFRTVRARPDLFLPGVSVNPKRRDALDELARCAESGARLVKVLPNTQLFDPASPSVRPFYRALAKHRLPLLSHIGYEFTLLGQDQSAGEPMRLRAALDEGVTVIAAHGGGIGLPVSRRYFDDMLFLFDRHPTFYADTSSTTLPHRRQTLSFFRAHPEIHSRLLFGTDYPLPVLWWTAGNAVPFRRLPDVRKEKNPFDRQQAILAAAGVRFNDFSSLLK
jgi:uncharacterized protein